jgi:hypothetical protein
MNKTLSTLRTRLPVAVLGLSLVLSLGACKSKLESSADDYLEDGKYQNAMNLYNKAEQKGKDKVSEEFYDNYSLAMVKNAVLVAKKNATDERLIAYAEQLYDIMPKIKSDNALDTVLLNLGALGISQTKAEFDFEATLQGFRNLDSAISKAKAKSRPVLASLQADRKAAEDIIVKKQIEASTGAENSIGAEYELLSAELFAPNDPALKYALDTLRVKNRKEFLVFEWAGIEQPSRYVNKYGFVIALADPKLGPTSLTGTFNVINFTANNETLDISKIKLISTEQDGKRDTVTARQTGKGECQENDDMVKKYKAFKNKAYLHTERECNVLIAFNYKKGFVPDFVEFTSNDHGQNKLGRKYLGGTLPRK